MSSVFIGKQAKILKVSFARLREYSAQEVANRKAMQKANFVYFARQRVYFALLQHHLHVATAVAQLMSKAATQWGQSKMAIVFTHWRSGLLKKAEIIASFNALRRTQRTHEGDCVICLNAQSTTVFMPCKHLVCCNACDAMTEDCPMCRTPITERINVYRS